MSDSANNRNNFSNPKAPDHVPVPQFALPNQKKVNKIFGGMTPRSVTASMRAFSNVVMTPRAADGRADSTGMTPKLTQSGNSNVKVVKGPRKSAPEKSIFNDNNSDDGNESEKYVDRAMQRRLAEKGQQSDSIVLKDESRTNYFSELVKQDEPQLIEPVNQKDTIYVSNNKTRGTVNLSEDIFPDAGEYNFETAVSTNVSTTNNSKISSLGLIGGSNTNNNEMNKSIVATVEALIQENHLDRESHPDYDYDFDYNDNEEEDECNARSFDSGKLSKRQKVLKNKQKIDRDLAKVTKFMKGKGDKR